MSVATARTRTAPAPTPRPASRGRRRVELGVVVIALVTATLVLGGFVAVVNGIDRSTFTAVVAPALFGPDHGLPEAEAYEIGRTLAAWFGVTLLLVLGTTAVGLAVRRSRPGRRTAGWWFLAAGLVCLLGSQLLLFPIAFLFLAAAAIVATRPRPEEDLS